MIRRRVLGSAVALFMAVWTVITVNLISGHDPALARQTTSGQTTTATTATAAGSSGSGSGTKIITTASGVVKTVSTGTGSTSSTGTGSTSTGSSSTGSTTSGSTGDDSGLSAVSTAQS